MLTGLKSSNSRQFLIVGTYAGGFFRDLAKALRSQGAGVHRIGLTGGDLVQWRGRGFLSYAGRLNDFPAFLERQHARKQWTDLIVFGDTTHYNRAAMDWARQNGLNLHILENGYFRPTWVTLEHQGVNDWSDLPRDPDFYRTHGAGLELKPTPEAVTIMPYLIWEHGWYYWWYLVFRPYYWRYTYPLPQRALSQLFRSSYRYFKLRLFGLRKRYVEIERKLMESDQPFFLAFLQREGDSSITVHSDLKDNPAFIAKVISSFAKHGPKGTLLVFKNHPLDPYVYNLANVTAQIASQHGVGDRVLFLDGGSFPELTRKAVGTITVNSTAALAAIEFGRPSKLLGRAFFEFEGLVDQQTLDEFWQNPLPPDGALFECFQKYIRHHVLVQGSFQNPAMKVETAERLADKMLAYQLSNPVEKEPTA